ncbi:MAG: FAD-dependent oxidoreductase, partial [Akkermansiaceae bacterium]
GLGGPRVMNTCGQMGAATGYAAALCKKHSTTPRGVYQKHIKKLRQLIGF